MDNVYMEPIMYGKFGWWLVWYALGASVFAVLLASVYPMWKAVRTAPAEAMRGD